MEFQKLKDTCTLMHIHNVFEREYEFLSKKYVNEKYNSQSEVKFNYECRCTKFVLFSNKYIPFWKRWLRGITCRGFYFGYHGIVFIYTINKTKKN